MDTFPRTVGGIPRMRGALSADSRSLISTPELEVSMFLIPVQPAPRASAGSPPSLSRAKPGFHRMQGLFHSLLMSGLRLCHPLPHHAGAAELAQRLQKTEVGGGWSQYRDSGCRQMSRAPSGFMDHPPRPQEATES